MGRGRFPAKKTLVDGIVFDSKREAKRYGELKIAEKAGEISKLVLQPQLYAYINDLPFCRFTADFQYVVTATGQEIIEDVKSSGTRKDPAYRLRKKAVELFHGIQILETGV